MKSAAAAPSRSMIADLPADERPRERLVAHGPQSLSDAELLALLLGSGTCGKNAIQLARELLHDGLSLFASRGVDHLSRTPGVGVAKAARIAAAFEISRRVASIERDQPQRFDLATAAGTLMRRYSHDPQEHLGAFFLDSRSRVIREREIFVGTVDHAVVSTRDIVRAALDHNAVALALFHNHPSGEPSPSAEDVVFTRKVEESLRLVDVKLYDHIVVGGNRYHSMRERGQI